MNEVTDPKLSTNKMHVLMIDDDSAMRRLFGGLLTKVGYEVLYASDGNEGRETARRLQPDIILMDQNMPVMDGSEATMRLKSEDQTKNIPIILFSNEDMSIEAEKLNKDIGANAYIHKSADFSILKDTIKNLLEKSGKVAPEGR